MTKTTNETRKRLREMAAEVFGDKRAAKRWLSDKNLFLNRAAPKDAMKTESGAQAVEALLCRIKPGTYS